MTARNANDAASSAGQRMTTSQKGVVAILSVLQFTIILDFMIMAPLGALLLAELDIDAKQFGLAVSAAAFSAGAASFAAAGFADRFDRKRLLLFFYVGFIVGTTLCGMARTYEFLLCARIVTGIFGGVIGSIIMAIVADLFPLAMRGRAMGAMMTSFSAAQIAGLPAGLALSNWWGWQAPFWCIAAVGVVVAITAAFILKPIDAHLKGSAEAPTRAKAKANAFLHIRHIATKPAYLRVFATTILLAGGFLLHPLLTAFFVNNLHVDLDVLPVVYMITGICTFFVGPLVGKLADSIGKFVVFSGGSLVGAVVFVAFANLSAATELWLIIAVNAVLFAASTSRMIAAGAINSAVPAAADRGAFMSINTALQQVSGGIASAVGGLIVVVRADGTLARFDALCAVAVVTIFVAFIPMWMIDRQVMVKVKMEQR